jgi:histidine triad (HIT) family protein
MSTRETPLPLPRRDPCPFCEYVAHGKTANGLRMALVSERARTLAFVDPRPMQPGHLLVITRRHAPTLLDLAREEAQEVIEHARDLSHALVRALAIEGINAFQNNGVAAGQSVPHYHMHLVPRRADDGHRFLSEFERELAPEEERLEMAARIRAALSNPGGES